MDRVDESSENIRASFNHPSVTNRSEEADIQERHTGLKTLFFDLFVHRRLLAIGPQKHLVF